MSMSRKSGWMFPRNTARHHAPDGTRRTHTKLEESKIGYPTHIEDKRVPEYKISKPIGEYLDNSLGSVATQRKNRNAKLDPY